MVRLILLALPCAVILLGFAAPFALEGIAGVALALLLVPTGSALLWWLEIRSAKSLDENKLLNRILKGDGDNII